MYALLPEKTAKYLKKEYRVRMFIILFLFLSLGIWVGIVTLFPSYILSVVQERRALVQESAVEAQTKSASTTSALSEIVAANNEISILQKNQDTLMLSSIIEDIVSRRIPGITITDFEIGRTGSQNTNTNIVISGKANTRNDLVSFRNNLEEDGRFSKVDLPVSYLAADTNISFTITLAGTE